METRNILTNYRLELSLESLHFESREWIDELLFFQDELKFLKNVILRNIEGNTRYGQQHKKLYQNIDRMLEKLSGEILEQIRTHESYLSKLLGNSKTSNDATYRENHQTLSDKMRVLRIGMRNLKGVIFQYLEQHPSENLDV